MNLYMAIGLLLIATLLSLFFSTLNYALRELSRGRLAEIIEKHGLNEEVGRIVDESLDMAFVCSTARLLANLTIIVVLMDLFSRTSQQLATQYAEAIIISGVLTLFSSVAFPHAIARHAGEPIVVMCLPLLRVLAWTLAPVTRTIGGIDNVVRRIIGLQPQTQEDELEQEILSIVEEGEKEGVVDDRERQMIESVIEFHDTSAGQIMTARPEIVGLEADASLDEIVAVIEESGHSRLPVYEGTLDHVIGVLYARDLLKYVGKPTQAFSMRSAMRMPLYVPETKPLRDLLQDFRLQKVHMAIVLDEYGGTAGLVTIEDTLEELVGEIADEHEPSEPPMFKRYSDISAEVDARIYIDELNRLLGLNLPDDAGYDTLGGYISNTLGRIPQAGSSFELNHARYFILEAEPQKVVRVRVEVLPQVQLAPASEQEEQAEPDKP